MQPTQPQQQAAAGSLTHRRPNAHPSTHLPCLQLADGLSSGASGTDDSVYVTLLSGFAYEVPGIAAAGLAVERAGRKATSVAALLQGALRSGRVGAVGIGGWE